MPICSVERCSRNVCRASLRAHCVEPCSKRALLSVVPAITPVELCSRQTSIIAATNFPSGVGIWEWPGSRRGGGGVERGGDACIALGGSTLPRPGRPKGSNSYATGDDHPINLPLRATNFPLRLIDSEPFFTPIGQKVLTSHIIVV